jgi:hypothetical protein
MATEQYYIWSEMVMVQNTYGTKWFLVMVRNCNFVVRNGILWNEMVMVVISYHNHFVTAISYHSENHFRTICRSIHYYHFVPYADRNIMTISYHMQIDTLYDNFVPYADRYIIWPFRTICRLTHMIISNHIKKYIMIISYQMQIDTLWPFRTICKSTHYDHFVP